MTEIIIRDGIVSKLTTQPTIVWDALRNGDNPYGVFNAQNYLAWNDFTTANTANLVSYYDENHDMPLPQYYEWKSEFQNITSIPWSLYALNSNGFFKYNGYNISFYGTNTAIGSVLQIPLNDEFSSLQNLFSFVTTASSSNDSPLWFPISLDYDKQSATPLVHRFHFRSGKQYATITINGNSFDITKPHLFAIKCILFGDITNVQLYIDKQLICTLDAIDTASNQGWRSYNSSLPNSFIFGGYMGYGLFISNRALNPLGIYSIFYYDQNYDHSEIFDLCKYRYSIPDITYAPTLSVVTLNATQIPIFGSTQFSVSNYIEFI